MPRPPRCHRPEFFFEHTSMLAESRHLLRPCQESIELIIGVIARALELYPSVRIHALNPLSTHWTELLSSHEPKDISGYVGFVKTNVAKELRRLHGLPHLAKVFVDRGSIIPVHPGVESVEKRWRYVASQGTKEDLVETPRDWLGVSGVVALEKDKPLRGRWIDRTAAYRNKKAPIERFTTWKSFKLTPLPHWIESHGKDWQERVTELIEDISEKNITRRNGKAVLGYEAVAAVSPLFCGTPPKKTPAPPFHAVGKRAFDQMRRVISEFQRDYRGAAERRKANPDIDPGYPPYAFPARGPMTPGTPDPWFFADGIAC